MVAKTESNSKPLSTERCGTFSTGTCLAPKFYRDFCVAFVLLASYHWETGTDFREDSRCGTLDQSESRIFADF